MKQLNLVWAVEHHTSIMPSSRLEVQASAIELRKMSTLSAGGVKSEYWILAGPFELRSFSIISSLVGVSAPWREAGGWRRKHYRKPEVCRVPYRLPCAQSQAHGKHVLCLVPSELAHGKGLAHGKRVLCRVPSESAHGEDLAHGKRHPLPCAREQTTRRRLGTRKRLGLCRVLLPRHTARIQTLSCAMSAVHTAKPAPRHLSCRLLYLPWVRICTRQSFVVCPISCTRQTVWLP